MPRANDRVDAWRRPAVVAARLERHVELGARRGVTGASKATDLGVACPAGRVWPRPTTTPLRTTTAPTGGFGTAPTAGHVARPRSGRAVIIDDGGVVVMRHSLGSHTRRGVGSKADPAPRRTPGYASPSPIRTVPSAPEFHRVMPLPARGLYRRSGIGARGAPHLAPKAIQLLFDSIGKMARQVVDDYQPEPVADRWVNVPERHIEAAS